MEFFQIFTPNNTKTSDIISHSPGQETNDYFALFSVLILAGNKAEQKVLNTATYGHMYSAYKEKLFLLSCKVKGNKI